MKHNKQDLSYKADYGRLKSKLYLSILGILALALIIIFALYLFMWRGQGGNWIVSLFTKTLHLKYDSALNLYTQIFRNNIEIIWAITIAVVFFLLLRVVLNWVTHYFDTVNRGIDALLSEDAEIRLPPELSAAERKLNAVKQTLKQRTLEVRLAEQRKNDLVMYLAHDIRTPLTSVIGYLSLLEEAPDMPPEQKARYVHITLDKACRLEKMINEFFEITRYNLQQIVLTKETIDLYYMLVQITDEFSPILDANGNTVVLSADENLTLYGDPDKLARVFNNVFKNAAAYSFPHTAILISAQEKDGSIVISFQNKGKTIQKEKLSAIFEKFYRLDESRASQTGGAGLGLAIAKEIVTLHGGTITASSSNDTVVFTITLPCGH